MVTFLIVCGLWLFCVFPFAVKEVFISGPKPKGGHVTLTHTSFIEAQPVH